PIELVSLRLRALATVGDMKFADLAAKIAPASAAVARGEPREAFFGPRHGLLQVAVFRRADIAGAQDGPLIIEERYTSVVAPGGWSLSWDEHGSLFVTKS